MTLRITSFTSCQQRAWELLQSNENVFLTGAAGTGKSFLITEFLQGKGSKQFPIVASTGAAAILVGGRTFHSFFGLGIMEGGVQGTIQKALQNRRVIDRLCCAREVIIDEISMLSGTTLLVAETIARLARRRNLPWGGLRIIAVGDFAQLPPVNTNGGPKDWAFLHELWGRSQFTSIMLRTVVRTQEPHFLAVLNLIRDGIVDEDVTTFFQRRITEPDDHFDGTRLFPRRATVDAYNLMRLGEIEKPLQSFVTIYSGKERYVEQLKKNAPIPEVLYLKEGALVMLRKNDTDEFPMRWINGSLGHLTRIRPDGLHIDLLSGETIEIGKENFSMLDGNGDEAAKARNFPVTLAWAATIHKAQGASLDRLMVDLSGLWEPGQAYVALSRVRSSHGLFLENWNPASVITEPLVTDFYSKI